VRHAILVVGSEEQREQPLPEIKLRDNETVRTSTWCACTNQDDPSRLLEDIGSVVVRAVLVPVLAYHFYILVQNTKLWVGKRPFILVRDRGMASRIAAYAGSWGGGDVVMPSDFGDAVLGPTRYLLLPDGSIELRVD
jgi:hypothetical protein